MAHIIAIVEAEQAIAANYTIELLPLISGVRRLTH